MSNIDELRGIFASETKPVAFNYSRARETVLRLVDEYEEDENYYRKKYVAIWEDRDDIEKERDTWKARAEEVERTNRRFNVQHYIAEKEIEKLQDDYKALAESLRGYCEYCVNRGLDYYDQPCSDCVELDDDSHFEFVFEPARFAGENGGGDA